MIDSQEALQVLLERSGVKGTYFPPTSRYHPLETAMLDRWDGTQTRYLRRRFLPPTENFVFVQEHVVVEGDRLDNVTAKYLTDPEQFWRLCDANNVMRPDELTDVIGRRLRVTLPEGIPGFPHA